MSKSNHKSLKVDPEFQKIIPPLTNEEFKQLENNILENGINDDIKLWNDIIIDGHNRYKIAIENDLSFQTQNIEFENREKVIEWMILNQMGRRNLSIYDKGLLASKLQDLYKILGKDRKSRKGKNEKKFDSREKAAKAFNISDNTLSKVNYIEANGNDKQKEKLREGKTTVNKLFNELKKEAKREEIKNKKDIKNPESIDIYNTKNKYKIIYADPPWSYGNTLGDSIKEPKDHYKLMPLADICNMPIKELSEENSVLLLWVVVPQIVEALKVVNAWGYKYKTSMVWDKVGHTMGHYTSVRHELLFICTKGKCTPENLKLYDSVYVEERTEHSKKPEWFRKWIDELYPNGNRIELFARQKTDNWDFFGNEI